MSQIKALVLDADGVLIPPWRFARYLKEEHGLTPEDTRDFFTGVFLQCLAGKADLREILPAFLQEWGWQGTADEFVELWFETENVLDERVVEVVQRLRRSGIICCLATNQERYRAHYMTTTMGLADLFDHLFFSHAIGCLKANPLFFESATSTLGLQKEQILFWDDSAGNVQAARDYGWNAERYHDFETFQRALETHLSERGIETNEHRELPIVRKEAE